MRAEQHTLAAFELAVAGSRQSPHGKGLAWIWHPNAQTRLAHLKWQVGISIGTDLDCD
jgi:hypothetical protein